MFYNDSFVWLDEQGFHFLVNTKKNHDQQKKPKQIYIYIYKNQNKNLLLKKLSDGY